MRSDFRTSVILPFEFGSIAKAHIIFAFYIKSADNPTAYEELRKLEPETKLELAQTAFQKITSHLDNTEVDLFVLRKNFKCTQYFPSKRNPGSEVVDAFTVLWTDTNFYAFPPSHLF